jgi:hypothetical protein
MGERLRATSAWKEKYAIVSLSLNKGGAEGKKIMVSNWYEVHNSYLCLKENILSWEAGAPA